MIWSPSLQHGATTDFGGISGISHMFLWVLFFIFIFLMYWCWLFSCEMVFFLDVLMLIVSCEMGFFLGWTYVGCFLFEDCDFSFFFFFFAVRCLVFFSHERHLSFQKIFFPFFLRINVERNMTKGLSWWEVWKRRVFWSLY